MHSIWKDVRYAGRQMRKSPGFAMTVVLTLALGIGANTAVFSVVNALLLRPLPYPEPQRLGALITHWSGPEAGDSDNTNNQAFQQVREQAPAVRAAAFGSQSGVNLQVGRSAEYVQQLRVSADYFRVLGILPRLGRGFTQPEDQPNGPAVAVLSDSLWRSTFHSDPKIVGKEILLKGMPYTVVGVMPRGAESPAVEIWGNVFSAPVDVWTPLEPSSAGEGRYTNYGVLLRLMPGSTWAQAEAQLGRIRPDSLVHRAARNPGYSFRLQAQPLQQSESAAVRPAVLGLMTAVGFILLIACANLAGLGLVRAQQRSGEMATRIALGATRWQLVRQLWTENVVLALLGGAAGLCLGEAGLVVLQRMMPEGLLPTRNFSLDGRVLLFTLAVSLTASVLAGMLPALELRRVDLRSAMNAGANRAVAHPGRRRTRVLLIAGEIALTMVLVAASGLLIRSLIHLETLPAGFDARNVIAGNVSLDEERYHDPAAFQRLLSESVAAMERIPGVESAAVGLSLPYERGLNDGVKIADGSHAGQQETATMIYVTPGYFRVLRMHLLDGRDFQASDTPESQPVAIVNEAFARKYLDGRNAVGLHVDKNTAIVGEVANVLKTPGFDSDAPVATEPTMYVPAAQMKASGLAMAHLWFQPSWVVRTRGPVAGIPQAMQKALAEADPSLPFAGFSSMTAWERNVLGMQRVEVALLGVMAGLAMLLSVVGVYGLIATLVAQRTREIGIRLALGSTQGQAMVEIGRSGVQAMVLGIAAGAGASLLALRTMKGLVYGVPVLDPVTLMAASFLLGTAALAATFFPARRIARIDPAKTLREE